MDLDQIRPWNSEQPVEEFAGAVAIRTFQRSSAGFRRWLVCPGRLHPPSGRTGRTTASRCRGRWGRVTGSQITGFLEVVVFLCCRYTWSRPSSALVLGGIHQRVALTRPRRGGQGLALHPGHFIPRTRVLVLTGPRCRRAGLQYLAHGHPLLGLVDCLLRSVSPSGLFPSRLCYQVGVCALSSEST